MTAQKELIIMSPTNPKTGWRNAKITARLVVWAEQDGWVALHGQLGTDTAPPPRADTGNSVG